MSAAQQVDAIDWRSAPVPVIAGLADTKVKGSQPYAVRPLGEIMATATPASLPKTRAFAFLPSLYAASDARSHAAQREHGRFVALVGDIDDGDHPLSEVEGAIVSLASRVARVIYSTASASSDGKRWRLILPLDAALPYAEWRDAQLALADHMAAKGIKLDTCAARPGQIAFLPNVPDDARAPDGTPWFFERAASDLDAEGLDVGAGIIARRIADIRQKRAADDAERERIKAEAVKRRARRPISAGEGESMLDAFNRDNAVTTLLERYRYERNPRSPEDWRSRYQASGSYATRVVDGDTWISLSGSDVAAGLGAQCASGCYGDALDLFAHYEYDGDRTAALRELHRERDAATAPAGRWEAGHHDPETGEVIEAPDAGPEPVDLWRHYAAPELPKGLLPPLIEAFARRHGEVMGVDPAGLAMAALAVCSAAISDEIKVKVKRHDSWTESSRLWVGLIGAPSMKKTPIINAAIRPLRAIDTTLMRGYVEKRTAYDDLSAKERKGVARPIQERRMIADATIEAAQEVLKDSPRGVLSVQDELSGWFGAMDKYAPGKGAMADRGFWLQAFNGGPYSLNRVARGACYIPNCSIGLLGGVQPEPIRAIANDTHDDGLIQRLIPVILRPGSLGRDVPTDEVVNGYARLIERLDLLQAPTKGGVIDGEWSVPLTFDSGAQAVRDTLEAEHLDLVRALEGISPKLAAHFGKHDGLFARLCVLWHCIATEQGPIPSAIIGRDTAGRVADFMRQYLRPSAIAFYAGLLGMSAGHEQLVSLASWIVAAEVREVRPRDVQASGQALRHVTADEVRLMCEKLEAFGWGRWAEPGPKSNKPRFLVDPRVHQLFADRGRAEQARRDRVRTIIQDNLKC